MERTTYLIIGGIHQYLINNLEETWNVSDVAVDHPLRVRIISPHRLCDVLNASNVRIWSFQYMFQLCELKAIRSSSKYQ